MAQDINGTLTHTIQSQVNSDLLVDNALGIMPILARAGELLPTYWSRARDAELSRYYLKIDHVSSAFSMFISKTASIPLKVIPRDMSIKAHVKQADDLTANINELSDWGGGWAPSLAPKMILSFITQDNGVTVEVLGDGKPDKERRGFYGLAFLDPSRVQRTSNPIYPIIYSDNAPGGSGNRYKMHHTRVMTATSMPSPNASLNGVGFCALSRMIHTAQHLLDMATTEQEELGSRPKRRLIIGKKGITLNEIVSAFQQADMQMDSQGLSRYSKSVVIASTTKPTANNEIELETIDLASVLKGEDKERSVTLGMFLIALALNIPPRWIWPATSTGATKADAMYQHIAGMGGGIGHLLQVFINMLGGSKLADTLGKPVPSHLEVVFDNQDDEQDRQQAEIREVRSKIRKEDLASEVIDIHTAREQMLDSGDITEQQFDDMELADGRLPDGTDVLNLFLTTEPALQEMLSISVGDVLNVKENDAETVLAAIEDKLLEVRAILVNPIRPKVFDLAKQAFGALIALKELYEGEQIQAQIEEGMAEVPSDEALPVEDKPVDEVPPPQNPPPAEDDKSLSWSRFIQLRMLMPQKEQAPVVNVTMPAVHVTTPEHTFNITMPEQQAAEVNAIINMPKPDPVHVENNINVPRQAAPIVNVKPSQINLPKHEKEAPPVINFSPQINVPEQTAPVVNVTPEINIYTPEIEEETTEVVRDESGFIKLARKFRVYRKD
jgi:hypothetical protein